VTRIGVPGQMSHLMSTGATDALLLALATISGILVARLLGPAGRGELAVAILWPSVLAAMGSLGLREAFTYEVAKTPSLRAKLTGHAILLALGQSILLVGLGFVLIPWLTRSQPPEVTQAALAFLWFIPANLLAAYALGLLQGELAITIFNMIRLSVNVAYLAAVLILWGLGEMTVWNVTLGLLIANFITASFAVISVLAKYGVRWSMDRVLTRRLFSYGVRNHAGNLSSLLNQRMDQMLMALLLAPVQLGWYTAAVNISGLARLGSGAFGTLVFPKVAATDQSEQRRVTRSYSRLNATITTASGLALMAAIPILVPLLYGPEYRPSVLSAEILTVAAVFVGIGQAWAGTLRGLGHPMEPAKAEMIALIVTVVGLALTLQRWGILGASLTSLVAYLVSSIYMYVQIRRLLSLNLRDVIWPVSPAAIRARVMRSR
jgi:O-antigen/teichoic acid export membrane protein